MSTYDKEEFMHYPSDMRPPKASSAPKPAADTSDGLTYIETVFAPYTGAKTYIYKTVEKVTSGDYLAVQTPNGSLQIVKVKTPDVPKPNYKCKWAFQKIELGLLADLEDSELQADGVKRL